mmetsp:Transcript_4727/g.10843  ORF Transcript_4727/g.10843 Transcript_4727/m.10843 type:complete len:234 (-) Transcript_4727:80-781(-)
MPCKARISMRTLSERSVGRLFQAGKQLPGRRPGRRRDVLGPVHQGFHDGRLQGCRGRSERRLADEGIERREALCLEDAHVAVVAAHKEERVCWSAPKSHRKTVCRSVRKRDLLPSCLLHHLPHHHALRTQPPSVTHALLLPHVHPVVPGPGPYLDHPRLVCCCQQPRVLSPRHRPHSIAVLPQHNQPPQVIVRQRPNLQIVAAAHPNHVSVVRPLRHPRKPRIHLIVRPPRAF